MVVASQVPDTGILGASAIPEGAYGLPSLLDTEIPLHLSPPSLEGDLCPLTAPLPPMTSRTGR